jgi:hypothetical protein
VDLLLPTGVYHVAVRLLTGTGPIGFVVGAAIVTDPAGARASDTSTDPDGTSTTTSTSTGDSTTGGSQTSTDPYAPPDSSGSSDTTTTDRQWWYPEQYSDPAQWY